MQFKSGLLKVIKICSLGSGEGAVLHTDCINSCSSVLFFQSGFPASGLIMMPHQQGDLAADDVHVK